MKTQARLRLRQIGKHHRTDDHRNMWPDWVYRLGLHANMCRAFEYNAWPRHYGEPVPRDYPQMTNYITGKIVWSGRPSDLLLHYA